MNFIVLLILVSVIVADDAFGQSPTVIDGRNSPTRSPSNFESNDPNYPGKIRDDFHVKGAPIDRQPSLDVERESQQAAQAAKSAVGSEVIEPPEGVVEELRKRRVVRDTKMGNGLGDVDSQKSEPPFVNGHYRVFDGVGRVESFNEFVNSNNIKRWMKENPDLVDSFDKYASSSNVQQVNPGVPIGDDAVANRVCSGDFCGLQPRSTYFSERIAYSEKAHESVVLVRNRKKGGGWESHCSAVVISDSYAITALHCFASSGNALAENFNFEISKELNWSKGVSTEIREFEVLSGEANGEFTIHSVSAIYIAYPMEGLPVHRYGQAPDVDLALFSFTPPLCEKPKNLKLGSTSVAKGTAVTFSGYGKTDISGELWNRYAAFNLIKNLEIKNGGEKILWLSGDNGFAGGPCVGDSGGPVYLGFERGYTDDLNTVVGVVSHIEGKVESASECFYREGVAVRLDSYVPAICRITNNLPFACK